MAGDVQNLFIMVSRGLDIRQGSGEGQMMHGQVRVKSQKYSEFGIGGRETCLNSKVTFHILF